MSALHRISSGVAFAAAALLVLLSSGLAYAQAAQVTTDVGPHYVGEPVSVRVTAVGFDEEPTPEAEVAPPSGGRLELVGVSPSVSQSITIVNGKMSRTREVTHVFQFRFTPTREGQHVIGPFRIQQGAKQARVAQARLQVQGMPSTGDVQVEVVLPKGDVFVGERIPVTVRFRLERSLQQNVLGYTLRVPLFDEQSAFRFLDDENAGGDTNVRVETGQGVLELRGNSSEEREGGKRFTVVSVTRTMIPLSAGQLTIAGASISVEEGVRFRRDFFGGRRATQVRRWRAESPERKLAVRPIPGREQPPSFGGAIGRGFSLDVSADRTVVQVGDPITLTITLRGEGLESASLPPLDAEGLLSAEQFRVPSGIPTGERQGDAKQFTAVVRVLDDRVREIPALAYSWFDPKTKEYETTYSRPIALAARAAEVIGAGDVQVSQAVEETPSPLAEALTGTARSGSLRLTGADLAIEQDPGAVLGARASLGGRWLAPSLYAGSLLLVVAAWVDRRRRQVDPEEVRKARVLADARAAVRGAGQLPAAEGARAIAQALRQVLREHPETSRTELDAVLAACEALEYAPEGAAGALDESLEARALACLDAVDAR